MSCARLREDDEEEDTGQISPETLRWMTAVIISDGLWEGGGADGWTHFRKTAHRGFQTRLERRATQSRVFSAMGLNKHWRNE